MNVMKSRLLLAAIVLIAAFATKAAAQEPGDLIDPNQSLPTILSVKISGGYGIGRARQLYGFNGSDPVYWSTGQGAKLDMAFDIPLLPVEVLNTDENAGPERIPYVALELEAATGYHISVGGNTSEQQSDGGIKSVQPTHTYIPITLGLNARASFGAGLPSVYIGAGGGVHIKGIYEDSVTYSNSPTKYVLTYDPPIPFELYGVLGMEIPLLYSAEDGNSPVDLFAQLRLSEATNYIYQYTQTSSDGTSTVVKLNAGEARTASNVALNLGIKINIY